MSNLLFVLTGSIACYKACDAISQLVQQGHSVRAVVTKAAREFVGIATLEGLTRHKVAEDLFAPGEALEHISLTRWADLVAVCPATANTINRLAAGLADDLAGALLLAHDWSKPVLVAPAMNPAMWMHPATRASCDKLRSWGVTFVSPGAGRTACGEVGEGRLAEPDEIVAAIEAALRACGAATRPGRSGSAAIPSDGSNGRGDTGAPRLRVLITAGGTSEPIDGVRVLTNTSTGATGASLAEHFRRRGHDVFLLRARQALPPRVPGEEETFVTFSELDAALQRRLGSEDFDVVIHAAAVSDFAVASVEVDGTELVPGQGKIPSAAAPVIRLRRNPKLLDALRAHSRNPHLRVIAFKLTQRATPDQVRAAVEAILAPGTADYVVHNDLAEQRDGRFPASLWSRTGPLKSVERESLAAELEALLLADRAAR